MNISSPLPPMTSTVSTPAPPSLRSLPSPGFQIIRSAARLAEDLVDAGAAGEHVVAAPPNRKSTPPFPNSESLPACPNKRSAAEPPISVSLPLPPNRMASGKGAVRFVEGKGIIPRESKDLHAGRVGDGGRPAQDATAPPFTLDGSAASRLTTMALSAASPRIVNWPLAKNALTAGVIRSPSCSNAEILVRLRGFRLA